MTPQITELIEKIRALESDRDAELAKRRANCASVWSTAALRLRKSSFAAISSCVKNCCPICSELTRL